MGDFEAFTGQTFKKIAGYGFAWGKADTVDEAIKLGPSCG